jgi:hypothetical protein
MPFYVSKKECVSYETQCISFLIHKTEKGGGFLYPFFKIFLYCVSYETPGNVFCFQYTRNITPSKKTYLYKNHRLLDLDVSYETTFCT